VSSATLAYINRSVDAAFDLVMRDQRAWDRFDLTADGFYRSFLALLVIAPMNILQDVIGTYAVNAERLANGNTTLATYGFQEGAFWTIALAIQWMIFPIAMIFVLRFLGLTHRYAPLIIAHNWGTIVVYLFNMPAFLLYAAGIIGVEGFFLLYMIVLVYSLYYRYYTAETALGAGWSPAASVTILGFVLQLFFFYVALPYASAIWLPPSAQ
jgi:hypothetical protein